MSIASQISPKSEINHIDIRFSYLYGEYDDGKKITIPDDLKSIYSEWKSYVIGEQLHYSLETMFWVVLQYMKKWPSLSSREFIIKMVSETKSVLIKEGLISLAEASKLSFLEMLNIIDKRKIEKLNWSKDENSFYSLYQAITKNIKAKNTSKALSEAFTMYAKVVSRYSGYEGIRNLYGPTRPLGEHYPDLNPYILFKDKQLQAGISVDKGLEYIYLTRIINRHLKIAVKKYNNIPQSTFKFMLHDQKLEWIGDVTPSFTTPRLDSAMNILEDIGLAKWSPAKILKPGADLIK